MTPPTNARLAYEEPDDPQAMAKDCGACQNESHLARASARIQAARSVVESAPNTLLQMAPRPVRRTAYTVSDTAAKFAARLFD